LLDEVWITYQKAIDDGTIQLQPEQTSPEDPWPGRCLDPHLKVPEICRVMRHPEILRWIRLLMDRPPAPFQTITCHKGSQQGVHSDSIHMTTYPLGYLTAAWIAFEDIHPDSGPLVYYPGSHHLPYLFSRDLGIDENNFREHGYKAYLELYEPRIQEVIREHALEPRHFMAKKGDVLIWHANLLHGGSLRGNPRLSRKALVCHYFVEGTVCYHDLSANVARPFSGTCLVERGKH
jgi:ectoine hydroxylase-related dioxygenase (phytanoyl-CoA dioxygenase family)